MAPSILTPTQACFYYCEGYAPAYTQFGDVRRCPHGRILVAVKVGQNIISPRWRVISPVFEPIRYRRARRALQGQR